MFKIFYTSIIAVAILASCSTSESSEVQKVTSLSKVMVKEIRDNSQSETLSFSGTLEEDKSVSLGFSVMGTIQSIAVKEGDRVTAGQLLATIDPTEYDNALASSKASLMQALDDYNRIKILFEKGSYPERDFVGVKTRMLQAEANKNLSEKRMKDTKLRASISGVITAKNMELGATAAPGSPVFTIVKTDKVFSTLSVPEMEIGKIAVGNECLVTIPTLEEQIIGKVSIINPVADKVSKSYAVKVELINESGKLYPGMITKNELSTGKIITNVTVPSHAIVRDADNLNYVFVLTDKSLAKLRRISIDGLSDNEVVVSSGLSIGESIVVEGQTRIKDGQLVTTL